MLILNASYTDHSVRCLSRRLHHLVSSLQAVTVIVSLPGAKLLPANIRVLVVTSRPLAVLPRSWGSCDCVMQIATRCRNAELNKNKGSC